MIDRKIDILIIGGGLIGAALMLALSHTDYTTLLVDASSFEEKSEAHFDSRTLALSPASMNILEMLHVWPLLENHITPIKTIHVSDQCRFGVTRLRSEPQNPLGYVVEMQPINHALHQLLKGTQRLFSTRLIALDQQNVIATLATPEGEMTVQAKLVIAADGTESAVRHLSGLNAKIKDYNQHAVVTNIGLARSHQFYAYERFTPSGPLALLPMTQNRASLVWAMHPKDAEALLAMNEKIFLERLQQQVGYRLGRFVRAGQRAVYPLRQVLICEQTSWPLVFVGNAAHTLHPVGGQGFNLGLRDVATLAQCIIQQGLNPTMLQHYQSLRRSDQRAIIHLTDSLINLFTSRIPGIPLGRTLGLIALDNVPFLKRYLTQRARGFSGHASDLVCGIPLGDAT